MSPLWLSIEVASIALVNIVIVGLCLSYVLKRYNFKGKALIDSIVTLPLVLPPVVVGFALLVVFTPGNAFGAWLEAHGLGVVFSKAGAVLASSIIGFPLFYQTVRAALGSVDATMEDVARTLGASELRIFFTISIPLAWKGILTGAILAFSRALGEFGATILIAGNIPGLTRTMPLAIYSLVEFGDYSGAFELVGYICALTLGLLWFVHFITKGTLFGNRE
ncbi:MAG: molybdate ABC transporter permease subunit [Veillonella sp.]|uniref:molybdate ABC transporter permease subunit n=1 Tax=Veillonella sp. TaxID=1926307 RepID=UPI0025D70EA7|nr:molybdate ABC transporter permease subunit [Veillonella sp.]MBS4913318.1 molybdate ABC transporter permease subunit [Veillonella sp.]